LAFLESGARSTAGAFPPNPVKRRARPAPQIAAVKPNLGLCDRAIRLFLGLTILAIGVALDTKLGLLGLVPIATAALGWCPLYCPLKLNTLKDTGGN
jgi:hypothetical protein